MFILKKYLLIVIQIWKYWKCNVVYLSNESSLFTGTIRENICLGKIVANKTIENLCRNFAIDDYINNLPNKLEEKIKPNQSNLSTGQKQRIALIRAILSEPDILILDEALSNIDIENRINIVKSLEECDFMKIYISHDDLGIINASNYHIKNKKWNAIGGIMFWQVKIIH